MTSWFEAAFDREYLAIYAHRDEQDAAQALAFLERVGAIHPGRRILDLCCGNGRHSLPLCRAGHRVIGFDLSQDLLRDFCARAERSVPLVRGDMRSLSFRGGVFDAVLSLFTSFGYFAEDEENWSVLREVGRVLRPGGAFVLDFLNAARVRAELRPHSERRLASGLHVTEERTIDPAHHRVTKAVTLSRDGATVRRWHESVRLFTRAEIEAALERSGFGGHRAFGDFDGSPAGEGAPRLIMLSHRAG